MIAAQATSTSSPAGAARPGALPRVSRGTLRWFERYSRRHLASHFHCLRITRQSARPPAGESIPLVVYANHASWWDPLVGIFLNRELFSNRILFAPIDAAMLRRYRFFAKLGFFGVDQDGGPRGAAQFLKTARAVLASANASLWLTPQGRFCDARERPPAFEPGIAHLAAKTPGVTFLPMALEYVFWEERLPEILVHFGPPLVSGKDCAEASASASVGDWGARLETGLRNAQDTLAQLAVSRDPGEFETVLRGRSGAGRIYDAWRAVAARIRGEDFDPRHGTK